MSTSRYPERYGHAQAHENEVVEPSDIVLLEESDLYRYHGDDTSEPVPPRRTRAASNDSAAPTEQGTFARSVRSYRTQHSVRSGRSGRSGDLYTSHATPFAPGSKNRAPSLDTIPAHYGAIRPGGPLNLFTRDYIGLLLNWMIIGFFNGSIAGLLYPLFGMYLGYSESQLTATSSLLNFGWYFKFIFGFITDNYAIKRQRRKPYIFIGWVIFVGFMLTMTFMDEVTPYGTEEDVTNADAPNQGGRYVVPLMIASFAHLLATVACEGMMVEFAHREGEYDRGRTQLWCVMFRFAGEVFGEAFASLGLNSPAYGGDFAHAIPLDWYFALLAIFAVVGIVVTHFFLKDEQVPTTRQSFGSNLRKVWRFIEQRATTQVMVACFFITLALNLWVQESDSIASYWLQTSSIVSILGYLWLSTTWVFAAGAIFLWFLNTNWRVLVVASLAIASVITLPFELFIVWDVVRSSGLQIIMDSVGQVFVSVVWLVRLMAIVEVAEPGLESMSYGLLTTVCNLAGVVVGSTYNLVVASWVTEETSPEFDTSVVRWHITYEYLFTHIGRLVLVLVAITILPRQKRHIKEIKVRGAPNLMLPIGLLVIVVCLFCAAMTSVVLSMFKSTMCLKFAGGKGCDTPSE